MCPLACSTLHRYDARHLFGWIPCRRMAMSLVLVSTFPRYKILWKELLLRLRGCHSKRRLCESAQRMLDQNEFHLEKNASHKIPRETRRCSRVSRFRVKTKPRLHQQLLRASLWTKMDVPSHIPFLRSDTCSRRAAKHVAACLSQRCSVIVLCSLYHTNMPTIAQQHNLRFISTNILGEPMLYANV